MRDPDEITAALVAGLEQEKLCYVRLSLSAIRLGFHDDARHWRGEIQRVNRERRDIRGERSV